MTKKMKVTFKNGLVFERIAMSGDFKTITKDGRVFLEVLFDRYVVVFDMAEVEEFKMEE